MMEIQTIPLSGSAYLRVYLPEHGGHGLCLANPTYAKITDEIGPDIAIWPQLAQRWMERQ